MIIASTPCSSKTFDKIYSSNKFDRFVSYYDNTAYSRRHGFYVLSKNLFMKYHLVIHLVWVSKRTRKSRYHVQDLKIDSYFLFHDKIVSARAFYKRLWRLWRVLFSWNTITLNFLWQFFSFLKSWQFASYSVLSSVQESWLL